jgi:hypothetical protein
MAITFQRWEAARACAPSSASAVPLLTPLLNVGATFPQAREVIGKSPLTAQK